MEKKHIFYVRHIKTLLHSELMILEGGCSLYYFSQGIVVEIDDTREQYMNSQHGTIDLQRMKLQETLREKTPLCPYQLIEKKDKKDKKDKKENKENQFDRVSKKYISKNKQTSDVSVHQGDIISKTQETYEITHVEHFDSFQDIFVCQRQQTWKNVDAVVILFSDIEEAFPFMTQFTSLHGSKNFMEGMQLGADIFVGEARPVNHNAPKSKHKRSYFMMYIENPTTFFVVRLQKYFASSVDDKESWRGIYEKYTSKKSSFFIPFQSQHRLFEYIQPIEDISKRIFLFIREHIRDQVSLHLEFRDLEHFMSYQLPSENSEKKLVPIEELSSENTEIEVENQECHKPKKNATKNATKKSNTKIPIFVNTRKTRHVYPTVAWFFEDIELNELQKHLSYITDEDINRKKIHYIFAEECLDIDSQQDHIEHSEPIKTHTNQSIVAKKNRNHLLIFSLESMDIHHPTFIEIGRPLQKPFVDQNIFIMIDEVFSPQITSVQAQHVFQLYREDDFACVFLGSQSFVFPKRLQSLADISQHVLSEQQTRLQAYIDQSLWKLQEWINLPTIPRNPYILSQSEGTHHRVSQAVFEQPIITERDEPSEKQVLVKKEITEENTTEENTTEETTAKQNIIPKGQQSTENIVPFGEKQREDLLLNDLSSLLGHPNKEEELRLYALLYSFLQNKLPYMASYFDIHRKSLQQMEYLDIYKNLIRTGIIRIYLGDPKSEDILNDIRKFYDQFSDTYSNAHPIFLDILGQDERDQAQLIAQQEFLTEFESASEDAVSEHVSWSYSNNLFAMLLCWQKWLPRSKNIRIWNQVRPILLQRAKRILESTSYPDHIHRLFSILNTISDQPKSGFVDNETIHTDTNLNLVSKNTLYMTQRNIDDFFDMIEKSIHSLSTDIQSYAHLFFALYAPDHQVHAVQKRFWTEVQDLLSSRYQRVYHIFENAHKKSIRQVQLANNNSSIQMIVDALLFVQQLIARSSEGNFDMVLDEIFSAQDGNKQQLYLSSDEDDTIIYQKILSHIQDNFLVVTVHSDGQQTPIKYSDQFFIKHRSFIIQALRFESMNSTTQFELRQGLYQIIDLAIQDYSVLNFRVALWALLTLLQGTTDSGTIVCFEKIQKHVLQFVQSLSNEKQFGLMQRYHLAAIYLACVQFVPFQRRLDFVCQINSILHKPAKELHMFRHFYLMSVALFSDQFLQNKAKEDFVVREYMRIVDRIHHIDRII